MTAGNANATVVHMNEFAKVESLATRFEYVESTGSTNTDLIARAGTLGAPDSLPDFTVLVAGYQTAGRGRSGRQWTAPEGSSLFVSVLLRPEPPIAPDAYAWLPLLAGLAMRNATARMAQANGVALDVAVKWPNDVLIAESDAADLGGARKVSGVLSELLPDLTGVVVGAGLNLLQNRAELPVDTATSLALQGIKADRALALEAYLIELRALYSNFVAGGGDAIGSGLREQVAANCSSVGRRVRAILPGDIERLGTANGIDSQGRLTVLFDGDSAPTSVAAGDIVHLRHG